MPLAAYALAASKGRLTPEAKDPYRSEFRRDIGRVLYCKAFRRLAFKTQVLSPIEGDHWRNRLTHTLECAQIARVAAEALGANPELAEAVALAHDLGHPPFGHQGERVLNEQMKAFGGFDHNLQNLRVVAMLEVKSPLHAGLNLTIETLCGIAKSPGAKRFLCEELSLDTNDLVPSFEASLADWADDLAYCAADFDDYARYHELSGADLRGLDLALIKRAWPAQEGGSAVLISQLTRNLVSLLVGALIDHTRQGLDALYGAATPTIQACAAIGLDPSVGADYEQLVRFLNTRMYSDMNLKAEARFGAESLRLLFCREAEQRGLAPDDRPGHLALCDHLSGMTDRYALTAASGVDRPSVNC